MDEALDERLGDRVLVLDDQQLHTSIVTSLPLRASVLCRTFTPCGRSLTDRSPGLSVAGRTVEASKEVRP